MKSTRKVLWVMKGVAKDLHAWREPKAIAPTPMLHITQRIYPTVNAPIFAALSFIAIFLGAIILSR